MTKDEIYAAFAAMDQAHPFYLAVCALLDGEVNDEMVAAVVPNSTDAARHFNAGRLAHALDFRAAFRMVMNEAMEAQTAAVERAEQRAKRREAELET